MRHQDVVPDGVWGSADGHNPALGAGIRSLCTYKEAEVGQRDIIAAAKHYVLASYPCHSVVNTPCPTLPHTCLVQQQVHRVFEHQFLEVAVYQLLLPATDTLYEPVRQGGAGGQARAC